MTSDLRATLVKRQLDTVYAHHGSACKFMQSGAEVVPILETVTEEVGTGYANAGDFLHIGYSARFRRHELDDNALTLTIGQTLIPTIPFAGHDAFEITSDPVPHGRKANQLIVQISPVDIP